jgi:hypothetical protein
METITEPHGHHKISAAIFVGSLIIGSAMILSAELTKPARYEYHASSAPGANNYVIFDNDSGRAEQVSYGAENPFVEKANRSEGK